MAYACPQCNAGISSVEQAQIDIDLDGGRKTKGYVYACPQCKKILSIEQPLTVIKKGIAKEVEKEISAQLNKIERKVR